MGTKGDKHSNEAALSAELFIEKISGISGISSRKMFGGYGIFCNEKMFGIVDSKGDVYLKSDEGMVASFEESGSVKHSRMPYYSVPNAVLSDLEKLEKWVRSSIAI